MGCCGAGAGAGAGGVTNASTGIGIAKLCSGEVCTGGDVVTAGVEDAAGAGIAA